MPLAKGSMSCINHEVYVSARLSLSSYDDLLLFTLSHALFHGACVRLR